MTPYLPLRGQICAKWKPIVHYRRITRRVSPIEALDQLPDICATIGSDEVLCERSDQSSIKSLSYIMFPPSPTLFMVIRPILSAIRVLGHLP